MQNEAGDVFTGTSKVVKNDPYELRFVFPRGTNYLVKQRGCARRIRDKLPVKIFNHQGWAAVQITSPKTREVKWEVQFAPTDAFHFPPGAPEKPWFERVGLDGVNLHWQEQYYLNAGYQVYLNDQLLGCTPSASFPIRDLDPHANYTVEIKTVAEDGRESAKGVELKIPPFH